MSLLVRLVPTIFAAALSMAPAASQPVAAPLPAAVSQPLTEARAAMLVSPQNAFSLAQVAERRGVQLTDARLRRIALANARWLGGEALIRLGRADAAERLADAARSLAEASGDRKLLGDIQLTRGGIFAHRVAVADALEAYQVAYGAFVAAKDPRGQAIALQSIANLYTDGRDFANAERYYRQAEEAFPDDPVLTPSLYNNRATALLTQERYAEAVVELQRALQLARRHGIISLQARVLGNLANAYVELDSFDAARRALRAAAPLVARPEGRAARLQLQAAAAQLALRQGNIAGARRSIAPLFDGVELETTSAAFRDAHVIAYEVFKASGDAPAALAHLQALRRLTDEETRLAASTNTALMAARFDFANQELRIARLKAEELRASVALERSRAQFQRTLTIAVVSGAGVIVALLSFGLFTIQRSRNQVRAANVELEATNNALEQALAAKTEFLANTSHEIRTPLNGILGMAQVMLADTTLPPQQRGRVEVVHGAGMTMRALVDDILDVAKMEAGKLAIAPEPTDFKAMLAGIAHMWREQAEAKGLAFELDIEAAPGWIETDPVRVRQVVLNLLSNALKFTESGTIALTARADEQGEQVILAVRDTGIGVPADKHEQIFESFRQADSTTTRRFGGTGLGLAICRNIAEALGGSITVASDIGAGSTFTVTLPLVPAAAPDVPDKAVETLAGGLVLIEQNPIARAMLRTLLAPRAGEVIPADDVEAAMAGGSQADRILADAASLGDTDAARIDSARRLAAAFPDKAIFILWRDPDAATQAAIAGVAGAAIIAKPISGQALADRLFGVGTGALPLVTRAA